MLKDFSFIDNPVATIKALCRLADAESSCLEARVHFDDQHMLDIGPYLVLGLMRQDMAPFLSGGRISDGVRQAVDATGLREFIKIAPRRDTADGRIEPFKLRRKQSGKAGTSKNIALEPSTKEKVATDLTSAVDGWLNVAGLQLTRYGFQQLAPLCTELLENAERHAKVLGGGDWAVAGLMERRKHPNGQTSSEEILVCNFAFINLGLSISDTIMSSEDGNIQKDLSAYTSMHVGATGVTTPATRRLLATAFATQDGVSRFRQDQLSRGGVGIMTAVEAVNALGDDIGEGVGTALTIISGDACIQFRPPYLGFQTVDGRRLQWFNLAQNSCLPPSDSHVFSLPAAFPGTILSARFVLRDEAVSKR